MSPSGLQKFLDGSDPYRPTAARLRLWYHAQPENLDTLTAAHAGLAIQLLTGGLPEEQRSSGTLLLIGALSAVYSNQPPSWLVTLRERYEPETESAFDNGLRAHQVMRLADGMTFCQPQHVVLTRIIKISEGDALESLLDSPRLGRSLPIIQRRDTPGPVIEVDALAPESRATFLWAFLNRFPSDGPAEPLRSAFYRQIGNHRLFNPLVELEHFLAFTGLEILAKAFGANSTNRNVAVPLTELLSAHGFAVSQQEVEDWASVRNAAFHRRELQSIRLPTGTRIDLRDHLYDLTTLLADLSLKLLPFDDGHIAGTAGATASRASDSGNHWHSSVLPGFSSAPFGSSAQAGGRNCTERTL